MGGGGREEEEERRVFSDRIRMLFRALIECCANGGRIFWTVTAHC